VKPIRHVRPSISSIPGALFEAEPDVDERGSLEGLRTLWSSDDDEWSLNRSAGRPTEEEEPESDAFPPAIEDLFEYGAEIDEPTLEEAFGGEGGTRIRRSVELERGTDALAWYVTFHAKGVQWGIYMPLTSIAWMMQSVFGGLRVDWKAKFQVAFRALHQHELFHFAVDYMAAQWEGMVGSACFHPARSLRDPARKYILLEEKMANAHMIRSFWGGPAGLKIRGRMDALRQFTKKQPPGYCDGGKSTARSEFDAGCERLAKAYVECIPGYDTGRLGGIDLKSMYPLRPAVDWRYCPIHTIADEGRLGIPAIELGLFRRIPTIIESEAFRKDLSRLPELVQQMWESTRAKLATTTAPQWTRFQNLGAQQERRYLLGSTFQKLQSASGLR
jgi:hypothetical protein